ncbi:sugar transferase [uncultured Parasphingorhabdus sp.]|uniref:sugar transferase n=1 Tax=uncultured Parasphingorhabdus sp. TaxID=2709694 RepID=UPI0030DD9FE4|tara:strand:- start:144280 stop:144870 length:591 start_codon:yes stop_codon:yes gene_type:complete
MKRSIDLIAALSALLVLLPVILFISLLTRIYLGKPIFFIQERPGLHGRPFYLIKFRTMKNAFDANGIPLPDVDRLPRYGQFLRSTSLDELPGLWNVVKGEMSLVGPRPLLMEYLPLYTTEQARRHDVRPGITGWAQINGRNAISWEEKFAADLWYVNNQSMTLDFKILITTIVKVLKKDGVSADGEATMSKFTGVS